MQTFTDTVVREWAKLMEETIAEKCAYVVGGIAVTDYCDYKQRTGYISGLETAKELFDIARSNVEKQK